MGLIGQPDIDTPAIAGIALAVEPPRFNHCLDARSCRRRRDVGSAGEARDCNVTAAMLPDIEVKQHVPCRVGGQLEPDMPSNELTIGDQIQAYCDMPGISAIGRARVHGITRKFRWLGCRDRRLQCWLHPP